MFYIIFAITLPVALFVGVMLGIKADQQCQDE